MRSFPPAQPIPPQPDEQTQPVNRHVLPYRTRLIPAMQHSHLPCFPHPGPIVHHVSLHTCAHLYMQEKVFTDPKLLPSPLPCPPFLMHPQTTHTPLSPIPPPCPSINPTTACPPSPTNRVHGRGSFPKTLLVALLALWLCALCPPPYSLLAWLASPRRGYPPCLGAPHPAHIYLLLHSCMLLDSTVFRPLDILTQHAWGGPLFCRRRGACGLLSVVLIQRLNLVLHTPGSHTLAATVLRTKPNGEQPPRTLPVHTVHLFPLHSRARFCEIQVGLKEAFCFLIFVLHTPHAHAHTPLSLYLLGYKVTQP